MTKKINAEILTVMFVDIVSYTKTTTNLDRENFNNYMILLIISVLKILISIPEKLSKK